MLEYSCEYLVSITLQSIVENASMISLYLFD